MISSMEAVMVCASPALSARRRKHRDPGLAQFFHKPEHGRVVQIQVDDREARFAARRADHLACLGDRLGLSFLVEAHVLLEPQREGLPEKVVIANGKETPGTRVSPDAPRSFGVHFDRLEDRAGSSVAVSAIAGVSSGVSCAWVFRFVGKRALERVASITDKTRADRRRGPVSGGFQLGSARSITPPMVRTSLLS